MMMIDVCRPRSIEWDQPAGVYSTTKDVLWNKVALVPDDDLLCSLLILVFLAMGLVFSVAYITKPVVVGIVVAIGAIAMFEPFVNEHVRAIVVERRLH
jgi:hypothetical protein